MEAMGRLIREMETGLSSTVIETQMETLAGMLEDHKGKKVYGYLKKKPAKAQVDAIVDELAKVPEVAECYEQWNQLRDELERYYKDSPREHLPLSTAEGVQNHQEHGHPGGGAAPARYVYLRECPRER